MGQIKGLAPGVGTKGKLVPSFVPWPRICETLCEALLSQWVRPIWCLTSAAPLPALALVRPGTSWQPTLRLPYRAPAESAQ
jgi:hypothetical protein